MCTVHKVLHCREKTGVLLMPVAEEADVSTVKEEVFSFNLDTKSLAESFDKLRSWSRSFNSFWENGCGASFSRTTSSSSSCPSTLEASSSLMSGSSLKIGTGISSQLQDNVLIEDQDTWGCPGSFCWSQSHQQRRSSSQWHGLSAPSKPWEFQRSDSSSIHTESRYMPCTPCMAPKL